MQEQLGPNPKPKTELLAKLFSNYKVPKEVYEAQKMGMAMIGSKNFTKIILFANEVQLNNDDIDFWCHQKPQRQEGELYENYRSRLKLQHFLDKFRSYLYDYSVYGERERRSNKRMLARKKKLGY